MLIRYIAAALTLLLCQAAIADIDSLRNMIDKRDLAKLNSQLDELDLRLKNFSIRITVLESGGSGTGNFNNPATENLNMNGYSINNIFSAKIVDGIPMYQYNLSELKRTGLTFEPSYSHTVSSWVHYGITFLGTNDSAWPNAWSGIFGRSTNQADSSMMIIVGGTERIRMDDYANYSYKLHKFGGSSDPFGSYTIHLDSSAQYPAFGVIYDTSTARYNTKSYTPYWQSGNGMTISTGVYNYQYSPYNYKRVGLTFEPAYSMATSSYVHYGITFIGTDESNHPNAFSGIYGRSTDSGEGSMMIVAGGAERIRMSDEGGIYPRLFKAWGGDPAANFEIYLDSPAVNYAWGVTYEASLSTYVIYGKIDYYQQQDAYFNGKVQATAKGIYPYSRTETQLKALDCTAIGAGAMFYDSTNMAVVVSTGTGIGAFGLIYNGASQPTGW